MGKSIVDLDHFDTQIDTITIKRKKKVNYKAEDYNPNKGLPCKKSMELYQLGLQVTENCNLRCISANVRTSRSSFRSGDTY